ncbi:hypothetical protein [Rhodovulum euryhalinum]|uniref:Uncharacterized protein n=1 Tax=Rhodovulum euryhalinum TaxID=35805 RepID=A0A4R2KSW3_9RHOB|nr:hypothetical protein [Rhodovulum euryhalinum]TCO73258.1 hypothetical protein EV655_10221 [Rhodovulum euryhalinum]
MSTTMCASCTFFKAHAANTAKTLKGADLCRFNPPVSQPEAGAHVLWPAVKSDDWCGHFEKDIEAA